MRSVKIVFILGAESVGLDFEMIDKAFFRNSILLASLFSYCE